MSLNQISMRKTIQYIIFNIILNKFNLPAFTKSKFEKNQFCKFKRKELLIRKLI